MATLPANIQHAAWGVEHSLGEPFNTCVVTDYAINTELLHQPEYDQQGAVAGTTCYDTHVTLSATIQVPKGITLPTVGSLISVDDKNFLLLTCEVVQNNQAYRKLSITAERYDNDFDTSNIITAGE
ncbi:MAG: hypothetical protein ACI4W7_02625 [Candidatus Spyradenecus sp.]